MNINFIAMGKLKESYFREACAEYQKRLGAYAAVKVFEPEPVALPRSPSAAQIDKALRREAELMSEYVKTKNCFNIAMCVEGKMLSSEQLAQKLGGIAVKGFSTLNFFIGSSFGLAEGLKNNCDLRLSVSPMTFPHSLARVVVLEQVYRAFSIINNSAYHK